MQQSCSKIVRAYSIPHSCQVGEFIAGYRRMLQSAIDLVWDQVKWVRKLNRGKYQGKGYRKDAVRLIPMLPKSAEFKRALRNRLLSDWSYAAHYVDSAIRTAYSILNSWRRNYIAGNRSRVKPVVKREFVRVKSTLFGVRDGKIVITVKPGQYLEFDISEPWFKDRVRGFQIGELILKPDRLVISFHRESEPGPGQGFVGWDCNLVSLDGFNPEFGWISIELKHLFHIHRCYELKGGNYNRSYLRSPH